MTAETWQVVLVILLAFNAAIGFGYRVFRLTRGGPLGDVVGQGILGLLLAGLAVAVAADAGWTKWAALVYGLLFGIVVMPIWVLAVLLPLPPERIDLAFTALYWLGLAGIVVAALAV